MEKQIIELSNKTEQIYLEIDNLLDDISSQKIGAKEAKEILTKLLENLTGAEILLSQLIQKRNCLSCSDKECLCNAN